MDCRTPFASASVEPAGFPGGPLPAGGSTGAFLQFNGALWVPSSWIVPLAAGAGEAGEVLVATGAQAEFQTPVGKSLLYSNGSLRITATEVWLNQWQYGQAAQTTIAAAGYNVALLPGNLRWLHAIHTLTPVGADPITYTVFVNGVATALAATLSSGQTGPATNTSDEVAVVAGDLISCKATGATAIRSLQTLVHFFLEY